MTYCIAPSTLSADFARLAVHLMVQPVDELMLAFAKAGADLISCHPDASTLEVDGGIKVDNIRRVADAGADTFVAGSAIFAESAYRAVIDARRELRASSGKPT